MLNKAVVYRGVSRNVYLVVTYWAVWNPSNLLNIYPWHFSSTVRIHNVTTRCQHMTCPLQLSRLLQAPLTVDKHTPPLGADGAAAEAGHDGLEPLGAGTLTLAVPRELQDLIVEGAGLQEHGRD